MYTAAELRTGEHILYFVHRHIYVPSVDVFFILADSDSSAVALNSSSKNKKHIHILLAGFADAHMKPCTAKYNMCSPFLQCIFRLILLVQLAEIILVILLDMTEVFVCIEAAVGSFKQADSYV